MWDHIKLTSRLIYRRQDKSKHRPSGTWILSVPAFQILFYFPPLCIRFQTSCFPKQHTLSFLETFLTISNWSTEHYQVRNTQRFEPFLLEFQETRLQSLKKFKQTVNPLLRWWCMKNSKKLVRNICSSTALLTSKVIKFRRNTSVHASGKKTNAFTIRIKFDFWDTILYFSRKTTVQNMRQYRHAQAAIYRA